MYTVTGFSYKPASDEVVTRIKRGAVPKNHSYVRGGNGTFAVSDAPQIILHLENEKGKTINTDIGPDLRKVAKIDGNRISRGRAEYVGNHLKGYRSKDGSVDRETLKSLFTDSLHHKN